MSLAPTGREAIPDNLETLAQAAGGSAPALHRLCTGSAPWTASKIHRGGESTSAALAENEASRSRYQGADPEANGSGVC